MPFHITERQKDAMVSRYGDDGLDNDMHQVTPAPEVYPSGRAKRKTAAHRMQAMTEDEEADVLGAKRRLKRTFFGNLLAPDEVNSDLAAIRGAATAPA